MDTKNIKWEIKDNIETQGGGDFWYDLTLGGYIKPEKILSNSEQLALLKSAIAIVQSFEDMLEEKHLLNLY